MSDTNETSSPRSSRPSSQESSRPPLPPRPTADHLLQIRSPTSPSARPSPHAHLVSGATTALSTADVNAYTKSDVLKELREPSSQRTLSRQTSHGYGSNKTSDAGDDASSIRSYLPIAQIPEDNDSIFGDALGGDKETGFSIQGERNSLKDEADVDFAEEFLPVSEKQEDEESAMALWKAKKKHFIILSAAGKPIYTRHGSDNIISSYVGILQTIISSYESSEDPLRSFTAGKARFAVLSQTNLFLVAISSLLESDAQLRVQLDALYMQILSTLTLPTLTHIFSVRPSTDLRRPLQGTEVLLSSLADSFTRGSPSTLLSALECLKIRKSHRQVINSTLLKARVDDLLYGLIVAGGRLVSVVRPKKHSLHPSDLQLIFNMLFEAEGIKAGGGDSWIPVCLPCFNKTGYLYMYVSFLDMGGRDVREIEDDEKVAKEDAVAIILLSANKESFDSMRSMKSYLIHELHRNRSMQIIQAAVQAGRPSPSEIVPGTVLLHFIYKSKGNVQFIMPSYSPHFESLNLRRRLLSLYHSLHASVHGKHAAVRVQHSISSSAATLAWVTPMFELYCVASPLTSRNALAQSANRVVQWVQQEEERVFIIGGAVF
jgi:vacuolar fusion protein MON1